MKKNAHRIMVRFVFMMLGGGASLFAKCLASLSVCLRKGLIIAGPACWHHICEGGCVVRQHSVMSDVSSSSGICWSIIDLLYCSIFAL